MADEEKDAQGVQDGTPEEGGTAEQDAAAQESAGDVQAGAQAGKDGGEAQAPSPEELAQAQQQAEVAAIAAALDDVRAQSYDSQLVTPERWEQIGVVPDHMTPEQFSERLLDYVAGNQVEAEHAAEEAEELDAQMEQQAAEAEKAQEADGDAQQGPDAQREVVGQQADGTPQEATTAQRAAGEGEGEQPSEPAESSSGEAAQLAEGPDAGTPSEAQATGQSGEQAEADGKPSYQDDLPVDALDIAVLTGASTNYLYSRRFMTDAYAGWSFMAKEDDAVTTLVKCARDESRIYPRPMPDSSLCNEPFNLTLDQVHQAFEAVQKSGEYPDVQTCSASNGDVYYFSTKYLTPDYATSLAEWASVERPMNR